MVLAITTDQSCTSSLSSGTLPAGDQLTTCEAYLCSVLAPHIAKVVFSDTADQSVTITWTT